MKPLHVFLFLVAALWAHGAEVGRSFFDLQLSHPKELWHSAATTNQHGTGELMLMKEGKGKVVHVSAEKKTAEAFAFNAEDLKRMQEQGTSERYKTTSQSFTNFLGERAYRITSDSTELRGASVTYFIYRGDRRYKVLAVCFQGKGPEADEEIISILKSMKFAK